MPQLYFTAASSRKSTKKHKLTPGCLMFSSVKCWFHPHDIHAPVEFTCDRILNDCVLQVFAHPLPAAFPRQPDVLRVGTVWSGQTGIQRASWHTADPSASAVAVSVAGGLKRLALLVSDAVDFTAQILLTCTEHTVQTAPWIAGLMRETQSGSERIRLGEERRDGCKRTQR